MALPLRSLTPAAPDPILGLTDTFRADTRPGKVNLSVGVYVDDSGVTPVMNGSEAVALAASRDEPFDLLLTDVVIPGMSGSELASLIHRNHPSTAILYASGYSSDHVDRVVMGPAAPLLEKPYSLDQLAAKVREVLDRRPAGSGRADRREINPSAPQP